MKIASGDDHIDYGWSRTTHLFSASAEERIRETLSMVPSDWNSILDVGCGDGRLINTIDRTSRRVIGLDISREALKYVEVQKAQGSIGCLPFPDRSFDIILCCELLEHLSCTVYPKALEELQRVARRYLLVTVPNDQNLEQGMIGCPYCGCRFHRHRHVRSYSSDTIDGLFSDFELKSVRLCHLEVIYPDIVVKLARRVGIPRQAIPFPVQAVCPLCDYREPSSPSSNLPDEAEGSLEANFFSRLARSLIGREKPKWMMALYERKSNLF